MKFSLNPLKLKLPVKMALIIVAIIFFGQYLPVSLKEYLYAVSLTIKEILVFVLPVIIFSYLASCILSFKKGVVAFIIILLSTVYLSNFCSTLVGYVGSIFLLDKINIGSVSLSNTPDAVLTPAWTFELPTIISNDYALYLGLAVGLIFSFKRIKQVEDFANLLKSASSYFLTDIFIPVVPIFITGFIIKLEYDGILTSVITTYAPVYFLTFGIEMAYILFLFAISTKFSPTRWYTAVRNSLAAGITGFSTMSSAAAMPLTLQAAERNTGMPSIARTVIPATVNIHMIGNAITIPVMAFALLIAYGMPFPTFQSYVMFGLLFAIAQFAVAAVPGGGILVMVPMLEQYLGFTTEMTSLMIALYVLFDSTLTTANITGNIVFSSFLCKILKFFNIGDDGADGGDEVHELKEKPSKAQSMA